jgi:ribonucleoside-diphosphate reductase alpha chain
LASTTHKAVRFLDDVITANRYVPAIPELREAAWKGRRIGLGYMGLADVLMATGRRYGHQTGIEMTECITSYIHMNAMIASIELAKERGPFPAIEGSIYDPKNIKWRPPMNVAHLEWQTIMANLKQYGIRNAALTTLAPTGTIGTVAGVEGYGIEPAFALSYTRRVSQPDGKFLTLKYASPLFARACARAGIKEDSEPYQKVLECGSCQSIEGIPAEIKRVFVTAGDLTWREHVDMQACAQQFLSNSVSKTINFPRNATKEDVMKAYVYAWRKGCCGLTVFVDGSRDGAVLTSGK